MILKHISGMLCLLISYSKFTRTSKYIDFQLNYPYNRIEKCNQLQKSIPGRKYMDIRRDFYLEKLIKRKSNGLIKVITGI